MSRGTDSWADAFRTDVEEIPAPRRRPAPARRDLASVPPLAEQVDEAAEPAPSAQDAAPDAGGDPAGSEAVVAPSPATGRVAERPPVPDVAGGSDPAGAGESSPRPGFAGDDIDRALAASRSPAPEPPLRVARSVEPAPAPAETGRRLTAAELKARRVAAQHGDMVVTAISHAGVQPRLRQAKVVGGTVEVSLDCPESEADAMLDAIADAFGNTGVEVELGEGWVRLWVDLADSEPAKQRAVWVPADLRERVRAYNDRTGESVSQLVLRAFNTFHEQLGDMFDVEAAPEGPLRVPTSRRRVDVATPVQLWMYWRRSTEEEIDAAVRSSGAGSRSALLTELIDRYLTSVGG